MGRTMKTARKNKGKKKATKKTQKPAADKKQDAETADTQEPETKGIKNMKRFIFVCM